MKPRMSGTRYVKELSDRVVITWSLTEPAAGIQDFTWVPTVNRFQAVLHKDGTIEMSYEQLAAKDAIVGIYPLVNAAVEKEKPLGDAERQHGRGASGAPRRDQRASRGGRRPLS